jgi:hypothetical protein
LEIGGVRRKVGHAGTSAIRVYLECRMTYGPSLIEKISKIFLLTHRSYAGVDDNSQHSTGVFYVIIFISPSGGGTRSARPNNCTIHFSSNGGSDSCVVRSSASIDVA